MTEEEIKQEAGEKPKRPEPKPPSWVSNRIAEALRGLHGAPRNIWTHLLSQQLQNALDTSRAIHFAAMRAKASGASPAPSSPTENSPPETSSSTTS